ncbi:MAG TPA: ATP-binding protein [Candidatus Eremiobacteraceae bacterium]|nr:ATP-binding protein [Candidatus Eremiobacteraceae bacterium]
MVDFEAQFPSAPSAVRAARRAARAFARRSGFGQWDVSDIVLAVGEACNNAVEHGHVTGGQFTMRCHCDDGGDVAFEIEDRGGGFELGTKGGAIAPSERGVRGLGIFLMRCLMDDVHYDATEFGTIVRLVKRAHPAPM